MTKDEHAQQRARVIGSLKVDEQRDHHRDAPTPRRYHRAPEVREVAPVHAPAGDWSWR